MYIKQHYSLCYGTKKGKIVHGNRIYLFVQVHKNVLLILEEVMWVVLIAELPSCTPCKYSSQVMLVDKCFKAKHKTLGCIISLPQTKNILRNKNYFSTYNIS